jgi:hypothetical protein
VSGEMCVLLAVIGSCTPPQERRIALRCNAAKRGAGWTAGIGLFEVVVGVNAVC